MYYIKTIMKNIILKSLVYICFQYLLIILYLFLKSDWISFIWKFKLSANLITNPIGTSINHLIFFSYITALALITRSRIKNIFNNYKAILFASCILEISHLIVPNRAFEIKDLIANIVGVVIVLLINYFVKWSKSF